MNKKQLIVVWVMGIGLSLVFLNVHYHAGGGLEGGSVIFTPAELLRYGIPILIIGGLSIHALRDKKK